MLGTAATDMVLPSALIAVITGLATLASLELVLVLAFLGMVHLLTQELRLVTLSLVVALRRTVFFA